MDVIGFAVDLENLGGLADEELLEGDEINHSGVLSGTRVFWQ